MSDDKDDLNGFDGLGKTNDDGMHFSEEELEAAMAGSRAGAIRSAG